MNTQEALFDIEISFLQLEFAIKLLSYCKLGRIERPAEEFDTNHIVVDQNLASQQEISTRNKTLKRLQAFQF